LTPFQVTVVPFARVARKSNAQSGSEKDAEADLPAAAASGSACHEPLPTRRIDMAEMSAPAALTMANPDAPASAGTGAASPIAIADKNTIGFMSL
jgi:hypothetical protein